jgi:putative sigma-54 modulation protein
MISSISITSKKLTVDETTKKYVEKKIGALDKYIPRHARKTVKAEVMLVQIDEKNGNKYEAEVLLMLPDKTLTAKDSTVNVLAAIDIVEAKLAAQLQKYKAAHLSHVGNRGVLAKFKRSFAREQQ